MQNYLSPLPRNIHMVKNLIEDTNTFDIKTTPGYQKSLELSINSLNRVEPGIYDKLINYYGNEKN